MASRWARCIGLVAFIMPAFLELTFPMAVLLGVLLGFGRMSGDREMIAARACGVSLYRLAVPVMMVALVVYLAVELVRIFDSAMGQYQPRAAAVLPDADAGLGGAEGEGLQQRVSRGWWFTSTRCRRGRRIARGDDLGCAHARPAKHHHSAAGDAFAG